MKQSEVQIGKIYQVKVSGVLKPVRVDSKEEPKHYYAGNSTWNYKKTFRSRYFGTVLTTGRKITLTAGRMRKELPALNSIQGYTDSKSAAANDKEEK